MGGSPEDPGHLAKGLSVRQVSKVSKSDITHSELHSPAILRDFIGRTESYERALIITRRLVELQRIHAWTKEEMQQAAFILSEELPIRLHDIGEASSFPKWPMVNDLLV